MGLQQLPLQEYVFPKDFSMVPKFLELTRHKKLSVAEGVSVILKSLTIKVILLVVMWFMLQSSEIMQSDY